MTMETDPDIVARLRAAGCVFAEDEARLLEDAARTPAQLDEMIAKRVKGLPLEQVVGWAEFCGLRIGVEPGVFVPRRRSEFLVAVAVGLARAAALAGAPDMSGMSDRSASRLAQGGGGSLVIVDLCCGTGALGLAVATGMRAADAGAAGMRAAEVDAVAPGETATDGAGTRRTETGGAGLGGMALGGIELHAAELDPAAVACARRNVEAAGGHVHAGDLFGALPGGLRGRVDVLICNAPYVPSAEVAFLSAEARDHEPLAALDGGVDGLAVLRRVASGAPEWLAPGGALLVETSKRQARAMASVMAGAGLTPAIHADEDSGATVVTGRQPAPSRTSACLPRSSARYPAASDDFPSVRRCWWLTRSGAHLTLLAVGRRAGRNG